MRWKRWLITAAVVLGASSAAWACNTPVYRYAMYNWPAAPYRVFYFHEGAPSQDDRAVNRLLEEASRAKAPLNVALETVDVAKQERFGKLPEVVRKAWQERPAKTKTLHAVFNTHGQKVYFGPLSVEAARAMVGSPARRRLGDLLAQGHAGVLVLLASSKADVTRKAELAIDELLRRVQAGEVGAPTTDGAADRQASVRGAAGGAEKGPGDDDQPRTDPRQLKVARITISRTDPGEVWLVRSLLSVEDDLGQYADEPMVFAVYGRARAMPPFVGKGITVDNLAEGVGFLAGACSCVIKDENPGVDLLLGWNWDAAAETLAADDPDASAGDGLGYRESNPEGSVRKPAEKPAQAAAVKPAAPRARPPDKTPASAVPDVKADATPGLPVPITAEVDSSGYVRRQMRLALLTLAALATIVFTAGMVWLRRRQAGSP